MYECVNISLEFLHSWVQFNYLGRPQVIIHVSHCAQILEMT